MVDVFQASESQYRFLSLPRLRLPAGYRIRSVNGDWFSRTVLFEVEHPDFDPVPDGAPAPDFGLLGLEFEVVEIKRPETEPEPLVVN